MGQWANGPMGQRANGPEGATQPQPQSQPQSQPLSLWKPTPFSRTQPLPVQHSPFPCNTAPQPKDLLFPTPLQHLGPRKTTLFGGKEAPDQRGPTNPLGKTLPSSRKGLLGPSAPPFQNAFPASLGPYEPCSGHIASKTKKWASLGP